MNKVRIECINEEEAKKIGGKIHQQLYKNDDWLDGNIGLFIRENIVVITFDNLKGEIPEIKL